MATFNPEFNGIWDCLLLKRASFESVYSIRGRRVKSHIACLIETLEELQEEEAEQSPETWPKPPTEPEKAISPGHTVTSEQSLLFTVTAADSPISPPALRLHTTVVHWRDAISLLEMTLVELRDEGQEVCILAPSPTGCDGAGIFHCWCGSVWRPTPYSVCIFFAFQLFPIWVHTYVLMSSGCMLTCICGVWGNHCVCVG